LSNLDNNRKFLSVIVIVVTIVCSYICYSANKSNGYEITIGGTPIAYVEDVATFNNIKEDVENNFKKRFGNINIDRDIQDSEIIVDESFFTSENDIRQNFINENKIEVTAVSMLSDNKEIAIVANEAEGKAVQEYIKKYYISKANLQEVKESRITNNITYAKKKVKLRQVQDVEGAAVKIINVNYSSNKPILTVEIKGNVDTKEVIAAATVVNSSNEILQGQTKVQNEGKNGLKIIHKQVAIENRRAVGEQVISESVVEKPENKIILKGIKLITTPTVAAFTTLSRGTVTSSFGERWGKMHNGIDIGAPTGTPIYASMEGVVSYAKWEDGYGKVIKIEHSGKLETIYGHCSVISVREGQKVKSGQQIGKVGSTGRSTGPHLHFEVRLAGAPIDPTPYLKKYK